MQGRSWMATWMVLATAVGVVGWAAPSQGGGPLPVKQTVQLNVRIDGTMPDSGVELVIKPGHPASKFKPITYPVKRDGLIRDIPPIDIETLSADRNCSFAIVLKEPGQPEKVFRRSLQINEPTAAHPLKTQVLQCYLSSQAVTTKGTASEPSRVATKPDPAPVRKQ